jgi:hypothetical protein
MWHQHDITAETGRHCIRGAQAGVLAVLLLALALTACSSSTARTGGGQAQSGTGATTPTASTVSTTNGTPTSGQNASGAMATPGTNANTTFQVSGVTAWVNSGVESGQCVPTLPFTFLGIITFPAGNPGGTLQYFWSRSSEGGGDQPIHTVTIQPGQLELKVYDTWNVSAQWGDGSLLTDKLFTQLPNTVISNAVHITLMCHLYVTSIAGSVSPATWCPSSLQVILNVALTITFGNTISVNPGPGGQVNFTIQRIDPNGNTSISDSSTTVPGGGSSVSVSNGWTIHADDAHGSYTEVLTVMSPMSQWGPQSTTFTKSC